MARTRGVVESLRALLASPAAASQPAIGRRRADATPAAAITDTVDLGDALIWFQGHSANCTPR
jgi:hypothetical protein